MNLMISSLEYDFHSLVKVAEMAGLAGVVSFHQAGNDYLVTFPDVADAPKMAADFRARLRGLKTTSGTFERILLLRVGRPSVFVCSLHRQFSISPGRVLIKR